MTQQESGTLRGPARCTAGVDNHGEQGGGFHASGLERVYASYDRCRRYAGHEQGEGVWDAWHLPECGSAVRVVDDPDGPRTEWDDTERWLRIYDHIRLMEGIFE